MRLVHWTVAQITKLGIGPTEILTTTGRTSGRDVSNPVSPIVVDGVEYLVGPYGETHWVRNARSDPNVTLRRGSRRRVVMLVDVTGEVPEVVARFHSKYPVSRGAMKLPARPTIEDFERDGKRFPVFRVEAVR